MKVCMIVKNNMKFDSRVYKEAKALGEAGFLVTVLACKDVDTPTIEKTHGFTIQRIKYWLQHLSISLYLLPFKYFEYFIKTIYVAIAQRADVYHAHDLNTLLIAFLAARVNSAKLIYDSHELVTEIRQVKIRPFVYRKGIELLERWLERKVDRMIMTSDSRAEFLAKKYNTKTPAVIRNCPEVVETIQSDRIRQLLGIPRDEKIILYQGVLMEGRGLLTLTKAMQYLNKCVLVLIGPDPGGFRGQIKATAKELGVEERVKILDPVPPSEILDITASADIGTSLIENISLSYYLEAPTKFFEYMMVGLPQVASDFPEMRKILEGNNFAVLVDPQDCAQVVSAINSILEDGDKYNRMKENAKNLALEKYNWNVEGQKLIKLYKRLLSKVDKQI